MDKERRAYGSFESHHPKDQCPDCGGQMTKGSVRCRKCWLARNPHPWKRTCIDCGVESWGERCKPCLTSFQQGFRPACVDCGKPTSQVASVGVKRCWDCEVARRREKPRKTCSIEGCSRTHRSRGLCKVHYQQSYAKLVGGGSAAKILLRQWPCQICGYNRVSSDVHRLTPGELGGTYVPGNMVALCANCHREVHRGLTASPEAPTEAQILASRPKAEPRDPRKGGRPPKH